MRPTTDHTLHIPAQLAMIPIARHGVATLLADFPRADDAVLIANELLIDAIRHSHGTIKIDITRTTSTSASRSTTNAATTPAPPSCPLTTTPPTPSPSSH